MKLFCRSGNNDSIFHHLRPTDPSSTFTPPRDDPAEPEAADVSLTAATDTSSFAQGSSELGAFFFGSRREEAKERKKKSTESFSSAHNMFLARFSRKSLRGFVSHPQETLSSSGLAKSAAKKIHI